jgi:hypothetical protein
MISRRAALAALGGGVFAIRAQGERLTLAGLEFEVLRRGSSARRYLRIHGDEQTARVALEAHMKSHDGVAFIAAHQERNIRFEGLLLDPNRMFSSEGAERNLRRLNPGAANEAIHAALARLERERPALIEALLPPAGGLMIALHNNGSGYSVHSETPISDRVALTDPEHPHEFLLATDSADFAKLAASPFNAVLQNAAPRDDDGSFSRLAARRKSRYVNIEARAGNLDGQRRMLEWVEGRL